MHSKSHKSPWRPGKYACSGERKGLAGISRLVCVSPRLQRLIANSIIIGWKEIRC